VGHDLLPRSENWFQATSSYQIVTKFSRVYQTTSRTAAGFPASKITWCSDGSAEVQANGWHTSGQEWT